MRLIDGDALKDRLQSLAYDDWNQGVSTSWSDAYRECADMVEDMPTIDPERENGIPRDAIEYILRKETVSTNPDDFAANEKFIKFMNDPEIASFGRWQHANGFNTALVAVKCDLDKIPDSEPERRSEDGGGDNR